MLFVCWFGDFEHCLAWIAFIHDKLLKLCRASLWSDPFLLSGFCCWKNIRPSNSNEGRLLRKWEKKERKKMNEFRMNEQWRGNEKREQTGKKNQDWDKIIIIRRSHNITNKDEWMMVFLLIWVVVSPRNLKTTSFPFFNDEYAQAFIINWMDKGRSRGKFWKFSGLLIHPEKEE